MDGGIGLLEVEQSQELREQEEEKFGSLQAAIIDVLTSKLQADLSFFEFKNLPFASDVLPNMSRKQIWDQLEERQLMMPAKRKGTKAKDVLQPRLKVCKHLSEIIRTDKTA